MKKQNGTLFTKLFLVCSLITFISYSAEKTTTQPSKNISSGSTHALISTMPKSGTWYMQYFFWTLSKKLEDPDFDISRYKFTSSTVKNDFSYKHTHLKIGHASCPGYQDIQKDPYKDLWSEIKVWTNGYFWTNEGLSKGFDPTNNPSTRIVYVFRNPLDQAISHYYHAKNHVDETHRKAAKLSKKDFLLKLSSVDAYIKQYHSFKAMQKLYPEQILLISYEDLVINPQKTFMKICRFIKILDDTEQNQKLINSIIKKCSKKNLRNIEKQTGKPLANDQISKVKTSHIRSGKAGRWKGVFSKEDLTEVDARFKKFGYSLYDFTLE